jgi:hypothetical protein
MKARPLPTSPGCQHLPCQREATLRHKIAGSPRWIYSCQLHYERMLEHAREPIVTQRLNSKGNSNAQSAGDPAQ